MSCKLHKIVHHIYFVDLNWMNIIIPLSNEQLLMRLCTQFTTLININIYLCIVCFLILQFKWPNSHLPCTHILQKLTTYFVAHFSTKLNESYSFIFFYTSLFLILYHLFFLYSRNKIKAIHVSFSLFFFDSHKHTWMHIFI